MTRCRYGAEEAGLDGEFGVGERGFEGRDLRNE